VTSFVRIHELGAHKMPNMTETYVEEISGDPDLRDVGVCIVRCSKWIPTKRGTVTRVVPASPGTPPYLVIPGGSTLQHKPYSFPQQSTLWDQVLVCLAAVHLETRDESLCEAIKVLYKVCALKQRKVTGPMNRLSKNMRRDPALREKIKSSLLGGLPGLVLGSAAEKKDVDECVERITRLTRRL